MKGRRTAEMEMSLILVFLFTLINNVSGVVLPQPADLKVHISDGEVTVYWKHPAGSPSNSKFNVEMKRIRTEWHEVDSCTRITNTYCVLSGLITEHRMLHKVRVQMVAGDDVSEWKVNSFLPNESELQPPAFDLWATSSTLTVTVYPKPLLRELFPFGLTYTIYLEETEQDKNTTAYLEDDSVDDKKTKTFTSLHMGRQYCVSVKVEGNGALSFSQMSSKRCLQLPEQEWFIIAVASLSTLGGLAVVSIMAISLLCYTNGPAKTPAVLKSPASGWVPLSVGEGTMEAVTDKGWFLSSKRTEEKMSVKDPATHVMIIKENVEEEERRTSMDSGVNMESNSAPNSGGNPPVRQEDSGCGSLGGPESSTSSQKVFQLLQEDRADADMARKREDSGVGLGCHLQDSGSLKEVVVGGNYRTQSPPAVQKHTCEAEEELKLPDSILAEVVTGYRAAAQACICSGAGQCTWCHKLGLYGAGVIKQYRAMCVDKGLLSGKQDFVDSYKGITLSSYPQKVQMDMMGGLETALIELGESFPLLTALTPVPLEEEGRDFNMNNVSLSLCDVHLTAD